MFRSQHLVGALLLGFGLSPSWAAAADSIFWAKSVIASNAPAGILPAADGQFSALNAGTFVWVTAFDDEVKYQTWRACCSARSAARKRPPAISRTPTSSPFEDNGGAPAAGGNGWESSVWFFSDLEHSYAETFNEKTGKGTAPSGSRRANFLTGSIHCREYLAFLNTGAGPDAPKPSPSLCENGRNVISWLLITLPRDIRTASPHFRVWASGANGPASLQEGTPDPDAIGLLRKK